MVTEHERAAMRRAIDLGDRARGTTSPNPAVGAVVIDTQGKIVGSGATQPAGSAHAEVVALQDAGERAAGATLVCTLEPCAHTGRTGPCTAAIVAAGIGRVVFAVADPNPVAAGGAEVLRAAGIEVEAAVLEAEAQESLHPWLVAQREGRPHVTWKSAQSLDCRIAPGDGAPVWLTSEASRTDAHRMLRAKADAIVVGSGTVAADDPSLTVRTGDAELDSRLPLRVVLDRSGSVSSSAAVLTGAGASRVSAQEPADLLASLHAEGIVDVLIEGGPTVGSAFASAGLVDRVVVYVAPVMLGTTGLPAMSTTGTDLTLLDATPVGDDLRLTYATQGA